MGGDFVSKGLKEDEDEDGRDPVSKNNLETKERKPNLFLFFF